MYYDNYYYGMTGIWWGLWIVLLFWIFVIPYDIPGQRSKKESAYSILQKRYAEGKITESEYQDKKKILEEELRKS
ncbi:SHOCT domain-containing protein [Flavobacterium restrictum]|uniref:SHOCT domain-containing protein n=1 Tax=Flavobacterium restrictum TaxID=2594428 RepID=A0A553EDS7_9FLAO|nr:SHOCT domain-containing protein [Flavobacterium restrictum]TRX43132.1 SHOCT domain-containing protein [Flavobacterium restrictum]